MCVISFFDVWICDFWMDDELKLHHMYKRWFRKIQIIIGCCGVQTVKIDFHSSTADLILFLEDHYDMLRLRKQLGVKIFSLVDIASAFLLCAFNKCYFCLHYLIKSFDWFSVLFTTSREWRETWFCLDVFFSRNLSICQPKFNQNNAMIIQIQFVVIFELFALWKWIFKWICFCCWGEPINYTMFW